MEEVLKWVNPQYVVIAGALISCLGGWMASIESDLKANEQTQKVDLVAKLSAEIKNLSTINKNLGEQNIEYSKNNELFVKQINDKADELNKQITGGESYCSFIVVFNRLNKPNVHLLHFGDTKLENITIQILDNEKLQSINHLAMEDRDLFNLEYPKCYTNTFVKVLYKETILPDFVIPFDESRNNIELYITIRFANRVLQQHIKVKDYKSATRKIENTLQENGKIIEQQGKAL